MKTAIKLCLISCVFTGIGGFEASAIATSLHRHLNIVYLSPIPGAKYISPEASVILRLDHPVDRSTLSQPGLFLVVGSRTGKHVGTVVLSDDDRTMIFKPRKQFQPGEEVTINFSGGLIMKDGSSVQPVTFSFSISKQLPVPDRNIIGSFSDQSTPLKQASGLASAFQQSPLPGLLSTHDSLPADFPLIQCTVSGETSPGQLFLTNIRFVPPLTTTYIMILDNSGSPIFYRSIPNGALDFKMQPNGLLTYVDGLGPTFYALDRNYTVVDSFRCGNGYSTDIHELRLLKNGHALVMSYDGQRLDMSRIVPGGDSNAVVIGLIVQELDSSKNVVFQWRSWDHFRINDALGINLLDSVVDYVHGNALDLDKDGNILISCRHMSEITKINRTTGEIMWRLGGKNNQFTLVNDSMGFSFQHAIRCLDNGNMTLFDNGNLHVPPFSRAVEYTLNESTKTATLVWQYRHTPAVYGFAMGYVQRLPNGNTLIGWGATSPAVTEVRSDGSKVFELNFAPGVYSYRAYRFDWNPAITNVRDEVPQSAFLSQNYPNPFNPSTTIEFSLRKAAPVDLNIYDVLGRHVTTLVSGNRSVGTYRVTWAATNIPSGVYYYRLHAGSFVETKKLLLLR